jgi:hypothetical protein
VELEGSSPVIHFESLTPELVLAEDTWSISLEEPPYSNEERESTPSPRIVFKEKKKIPLKRLRFDDEPYVSLHTSPPPRSDNDEMTHLGFNSSIKEDVEKAPSEGYNLPLNGASAISENTGDNTYEENVSVQNDYKVDDNSNMSNDE